MFEDIDDYNFNGTPRKDYGCMIIIAASILLILFGVLGWLIN